MDLESVAAAVGSTGRTAGTDGTDFEAALAHADARPAASAPALEAGRAASPAESFHSAFTSHGVSSAEGAGAADPVAHAIQTLRPDQADLVNGARTNMTAQRDLLQGVADVGERNGATLVQKQYGIQAKAILNHIAGADTDLTKASTAATTKASNGGERGEAQNDLQKAVTEYNIQASRITGNAGKLIGASSTLDVRQRSVEISDQSRSISKQSLYLSGAAAAVSVAGIVPGVVSAVENSKNSKS